MHNVLTHTSTTLLQSSMLRYADSKHRQVLQYMYAYVHDHERKAYVHAHERVLPITEGSEPERVPTKSALRGISACQPRVRVRVNVVAMLAHHRASAAIDLKKRGDGVDPLCHLFDGSTSKYVCVLAWFPRKA